MVEYLNVLIGPIHDWQADGVVVECLAKRIVECDHQVAVCFSGMARTRVQQIAKLIVTGQTVGLKMADQLFQAVVHHLFALVQANLQHFGVVIGHMLLFGACK